ncbi:uncharacterized protein [Triticum aestivum]|uniref:uncharacterized protein n=1 Tax=Triticum aestivum TaxID=4565 RepID=UPI0008456C0E|nr:uncharacterized protein LOC123039808 [Triticum aestivum]
MEEPFALDPRDRRRCSMTVEERNASHQLKMDGAYSTGSMAMKMYGLIITSLGFIVPLFRQIYCVIASSRSSGALHPWDVKDTVCFVSRTIGDTGGAIPSFVGGIRRRPNTFKKRHYVISTGTSGNPFYIKSKSGVGHRISTRRLRLLAATRRRRCSRWLYDTGASICITGDISILRGLHNAVPMHSRGVSGTELVSNKCGRISGRVKLSGIRYFPGAKVNLISGGLLGSLGCETTQNAKGCKIIKDGQVIGEGRLLWDRTYSIDYLDGNLLGVICPDCRH